MQQKAWSTWLAKAQKNAKIIYAAGFNPDTPTGSPAPSPSSSK